MNFGADVSQSAFRSYAICLFIFGMVLLTPPPPSLPLQTSAEQFHQSSSTILEHEVQDACRRADLNRVQSLLRMSVEILDMNPMWDYQLGRDIDAEHARFGSHSHFRFPSKV